MAWNTNRIKEHIENYLVDGNKQELEDALTMLNEVGAVGWWTREEVAEHIKDAYDEHLTDKELQYVFDQMEEHVLNNWESIFYTIEYAIDDIKTWRKNG